MITKENQKKIEKAIAQLETKTSGELVVVTVEKSAQYKSANFRLGILLALLVVFIPNTHQYGHNILFFQIPLFILGYVLAQIPKLKYFLLPFSEKEIEVQQRAMEVFFEYNLHTTRERTGILIFISLLERQAVILADTGINQKVEKDTWQNIINNLIRTINKKSLIDGILVSISQVGDILFKFFPSNDSKNEISDSPHFLKK